MKSKYSFMDFLTRETFVGKDDDTQEDIYAVIDKIEIPMIQRDYAQGRTKPGRGDARVLNDTGSRFVRSIFNTLTDDSRQEMELEFIYGSIEARSQQGRRMPEYVFIPLDGQQRLTTLFLLYWYLGMRELDAEQRREHLALLSKFTYLTRLSSRLFCQSICDIKKMSSITFDESPVEVLTDCPWYYKEYRKDPTVSAMLSMLDHIHKLYAECREEGVELLSKMEKLKFYIFPLNKYRLTEDLYIKMNARGKQLSSYENFKADLINWMKTNDDVRFRESVVYRGRTMSYYMAFAQKLDNEWTDIFWQCVPKAQPNEVGRDLAREVDDMFMTFFHRLFYISRILWLQANDQAVASDEVVKYFDRDESAIRYNNNDFESVYRVCLSYETVRSMENFLDRIPRGLTVVNEEFTPVWESAVSGRHIFINTERLSFAPRLVFQAVFDYFSTSDTFDEDMLRDWMRVVWKFAVDPVISNFRYYVESVRIIDTILTKGMGNMLSWLKDNECETGNVAHFGVQYAEECVKAQLIAKDEAWREALADGESHPLLKGRISCLLPEGVDTNIEVYNRYLEAFNAFDLNEPRRLWIRAMLAKIEVGYMFDKELGLSNDHENMKVYINGEFVKPMHALLTDIVEHVSDITAEAVLKRMEGICDEYDVKEGLEWVYPLVKSFTDSDTKEVKNLLADYTHKRKLMVRDGHVYLCYKSRFDHDSVILLNGKRNDVIKALLKSDDISLHKENRLYEESGRYFSGYAIDLVRKLPREDMRLTCIYRVDAESIRLYVGDAEGKEHKVSIHGAQALKIYDSMTDDDIAALIADVERRVAEVQSAEDPFNMAGAEA